MSTSRYRGSLKHKNRPAPGRKGTICPEWTHHTIGGGFEGDPFGHPWQDTAAHTMFEESDLDPDGSGKRYATRNGIAFVAQETKDGTWHGYPEPWNKIPAALKDRWLDAGKVTPRDLRRYKDFPRSNVRWALESDDE